MENLTWGVSERGKRTAIVNNFEYCKCKGTRRTRGDNFIGHLMSEHTHGGNVANALARQAIARMKEHMVEAIATPSASQGVVVSQLDGHVQMALPQRVTLSRTLRRHRQIQLTAANSRTPLPPILTSPLFAIPERYADFVLHDSVENNVRLLLFGDQDLLRRLERADLWIADGTFKVVPNLFYQLYTIHFELSGGVHPSAVYGLLENKSTATYTRLLEAVKTLIPNASPVRILVDFESAAINAFRSAFPSSEVTGCYFHLCQSVHRKTIEVGLKSEYESDHEIRGFIRCLPALSHVPVPDVTSAFDLLVQDMPADERVNAVVTYFEH